MKLHQLITSSKNHKLIFALFVLAVVALLVLGWAQMNAIASEPAALDEATLTAKSIALAQKAGLKGTPKSQRSVRMTLGEWAKLNKGGLGTDAGKFGLTPTLPVFVMVMRGEVVPTTPIELPPDQPEPKYTAIVMVLNANTGAPITWGYADQGDELPFDVP
jgi:hypothetical protein